MVSCNLKCCLSVSLQPEVQSHSFAELVCLTLATAQSGLCSRHTNYIFKTIGEVARMMHFLFLQLQGCTDSKHRAEFQCSTSRQLNLKKGFFLSSFLSFFFLILSLQLFRVKYRMQQLFLRSLLMYYRFFVVCVFNQIQVHEELILNWRFL